MTVSGAGLRATIALLADAYVKLNRMEGVENQIDQNRQAEQELELIVLDIENTAARSVKESVALVAAFAFIIITALGLTFRQN